MYQVITNNPIIVYSSGKSFTSLSTTESNYKFSSYS